ncbi:MAG: sensor domain-containing diguanylate cyclase [Thermodesulfobacteriota bacterium]|nr:sensor domain-containing diguanylate cyclase [Thermodesulfobacteriota bacterium]
MIKSETDKLTEIIHEKERLLMREKEKRDKAEGNLHDTRNLLKSLLKEMPVIVLAGDQDGDIVFLNRAFEQLSGYTRHDIIDHVGLLDLLIPDNSNNKASRESAREWSFVSKDGTEKMVVWSDVSRQFPIPGWEWWRLGFDITKLKQTEKALKEANRKIALLSVTDDLTGSFNRRYLAQRLPQEVKRARRNMQPLSVVLMDIDHFKAVNDSHGHQTGDQLLTEVAHRISNSIRKDVDWIVRYGGEEFLIVLPETGIKGSFVLAEKIRTVISEQPFEITNKKINISASFGVSCFEVEDHYTDISPEGLIKTADTYLFQAKSEGRNKVIGDSLPHS